jgi:hypothetical protein
MLIGKINPYVKFSTKDQLLVDPNVVEAQWMAISTERMILGANEVRFSFFLGFLTEQNENEYKFNSLYRDFVFFEKVELSDWGTDDSIMFYKVAAKIGVQITEMQDSNITEFF